MHSAYSSIQVRPLIAGAVEDRRNGNPFFFQLAAKVLDVRPEVVRRDEVQVVHAGERQRPRGLDQFVGRDFPTHAAGGDLVVLAEETAAGTAAEKNRAGAARAGERRLLAVVRTGGRNPGSPSGGRRRAFRRCGPRRIRADTSDSRDIGRGSWFLNSQSPSILLRQFDAAVLRGRKHRPVQADALIKLAKHFSHKHSHRHRVRLADAAQEQQGRRPDSRQC